MVILSQPIYWGSHIKKYSQYVYGFGFYVFLYLTLIYPLPIYCT